MLVLTRKTGEAILIDGGIRIVVISCDRHGTRIGIEAPASASILREELVQAVVKENRRAGAADVTPGWVTDLAPLPGGGTPPDAG